MKEKVEDSAGKVEGVVSETKLKEQRNAWKKEHEDEKVSFTVLKNKCRKRPKTQ